MRIINRTRKGWIDNRESDFRMFDKYIKRYFRWQRGDLMLCTMLVIATLSFSTLFAGEVRFEGNMLNVIEEIPERSTGLDKIYVCYDTQGVDLVYSSTNPQAVRIYKFSNLGGAYSEEVTGIDTTSSEAILRNIEGNKGYIIEDGDKRYYYWIVDYLPFKFVLNGIDVSDSSDCDATILNISGSGGAIHYFTINGQQKTLNREIIIEYETQVWDEIENSFIMVNEWKILDYLTPEVRISPPSYCSTSYRISGDKFLRDWNWIVGAECIVVTPKGVNVHTEAVQEDKIHSPVKEPEGASEESAHSSEDGESNNSAENDEGSNEINNEDGEGLGGSAPATIRFNAFATEGVIHHEWQMSRYPEFNEIDYRFNEQNLDYTFNDEGTFYLRYIGSNSDGSCEAVSDTYTVNIGASELLCPNAFTPDGDGVNDQWKVSYRSILDFKCWIFDRYGAQLFYFDDPQLGWDGMRNGKPVKPGVYYYVIQATGADGKKYKKSGDINILRHRVPSDNNSSKE